MSKTPWGTNFEIHYFDKNGNEVPEDAAVSGIIRETDDDGKLISETWLEEKVGIGEPSSDEQSSIDIINESLRQEEKTR